MKTLKTLTAALLVTLSLNAFASNPEKNKKSMVTAPVMIWGNPEDVNAVSVESLKNLNFIAAPEMVWGNPQDVLAESVQSLRGNFIPRPETVWGNPDEIDQMSLNSLKQINNLIAPVKL